MYLDKGNDRAFGSRGDNRGDVKVIFASCKSTDCYRQSYQEANSIILFTDGP